jgi:hypothetical protein
MTLEFLVFIIGIIALSLTSRLFFIFAINRTKHKRVSNAMAINLLFECIAIFATLIFAFNASIGKYDFLIKYNLDSFLRLLIFGGATLSSINLAKVINGIVKEYNNNHKDNNDTKN